MCSAKPINSVNVIFSFNFTFKEKKVPSEHDPVVGRKPLGTSPYSSPPSEYNGNP